MSGRIGFVGLGNIGLPMAQCLVKSGLPTVAYDLVAARVNVLVEQGATAAGSLAELARQCEVIGVCVRDDADVRAVLYGSDGILEHARAGTVVALHGTVQLDTVLEVGAAAAERRIGMLDACITGGERHAISGTLTTMAGGSAEDFACARPILEAFSKAVFHTGALGTGTVVKLCNNLMGYQAWTAAFEALSLARAAGVPDEIFEAVTRSGGHLTEAMSTFLGSHKLPDETRASAAFQNRMRNYVELAEKDLAAALALARQHGLALPATGLAAHLMARAYGLQDPQRR